MNYITAVDLPRLIQKPGCQGIIATLTLISPSSPYVIRRAIIQVQSIIAPLGLLKIDEHAHLIGREGEQVGYHLYVSADRKALILSNKFWSDDVVTAFRQVVEIVAPLHKWIVTRSY